jgi:hypothetical protein
MTIRSESTNRPAGAPRRQAALLLWLALAAALGGCRFLQDEFFFADRVPRPPAAVPADGD